MKTLLDVRLEGKMYRERSRVENAQKIMNEFDVKCKAENRDAPGIGAAQSTD